MSKDSSKSTGIGLLGFTFLIFLCLKLAGIGVVATWSWWLVLSPILIPLAIIIILLALIGIATIKK